MAGSDNAGFKFPGLSNIEAILRQIAGNIALLIAAIGTAFPVPFTTSSLTWDPALIVTGSSDRAALTCSGALLGQRTTCSFSLSLQGMTMASYVSAADTVTVVITNNTGGSINLASGIAKVWVWSD